MTTKVNVSCPDNSHWSVNVIVEDRVYDHDAKTYTGEWKEADSFVLAPTESRETYVHDSRRLRVEEMPN
jgi:hypothetical protein